MTPAAGKLFAAMASADADHLVQYIFPPERLPAHTQELLKDAVGRRLLDSWPQYRHRVRQDGAGRPQVGGGAKGGAEGGLRYVWRGGGYPGRTISCFRLPPPPAPSTPPPKAHAHTHAAGLRAPIRTHPTTPTGRST